ncbi:MAG: hypothetical protein OES20_03155 [Gammaproteobacteria bacterium]|nr:hypothetical protein [Gammaproteobacteria bacterium]
MKKAFVAIILAIPWFACVSDVSAASYEIIAIENLFLSPPQPMQVQPHAIIIASSRQPFDGLPQNTRNTLQNYFVYQAKVKVNGEFFHRLVLGNFRTADIARAALKKLKPYFSSARIYLRTKTEQQKLTAFLKQVGSEQKTESEQNSPETNDVLLSKARQAFLDENYARVIAITDAIVSSGDLEQARAALELAGTTRERQRKFAEAVVLYETLLDTSPPPEISARVQNRLEGIRTMGDNPKQRLANPDKNPDQGNWIFRGAVQQYYRDDVIDRPGESSEEVNQALVTDVNLQIQRRTDADTWSIQIDSSLVNDFIEDENDSRISQANLSYTRDSFSIIGGRQYRTVTGVYGRFDGFTFRDLSRTAYQPSYFAGNLVRSPYDGLESDNPLLGANLDISPYDWVDINLYLVNQEVSDLTDRQAIGSEFQLRNDVGFIYGIVDYDVFYEELNNVTFISNYRYDPRWTFNLTLGRLNSPLLSTLNALQGQGADSIDELDETFSRDEIYQLAEDRSSKSNTLYFGASYFIDNNRQLNMDLSVVELDAAKSSGGVDAIPSSRDVELSFDYSVSGFFTARDFTSFGLRLSDLDSSDIESVRLRSRFPGDGGLIYDPRIRLDHRRSKRTRIDQYILMPSIKIRYRAAKSLDFEADLGIEYSDLDLPDFDQQIAYSLYLGYSYFF